MNGLRIVATAAFLLLLPQFNNADAGGSYDGEWTCRLPEGDAAEGTGFVFEPHLRRRGISILQYTPSGGNFNSTVPPSS